MVKRVSITDSKKSTFICPKCKKMKTLDVSKFTYMSGTARINAKCPCGHKWTAMFEKRKQFRKSVNFSGTYEYISNGKVIDRGGMKAVDLSAGGAKIELNVERKLKVGEYLGLEFHLDDKNGTLIKRRVKISSVNGPHIGTKYSSTDSLDTDLGFYLMK